MVDSNVDKLIACYNQQFAKYQQFKSISEKITGNLETAGEVDELNGFLQEQAGLIEEISDFEDRAQVLKAAICESLRIDKVNVTNLQQAGAANAVGFKKALERISELLNGLDIIEKKNQDLLQKRIDLIHQETKQINSGKTAKKVYRQEDSPAESRFIDKKR